MSVGLLIQHLAVPLVAGTIALALPLIAHAAGGHGHDTSIGKPGTPEKATRTIEISMINNEFQPKSITVKKRKTMRFVVVNKGEFVHEFNIGTAAMHAKH